MLKSTVHPRGENNDIENGQDSTGYHDKIRQNSRLTRSAAQNLGIILSQNVHGMSKIKSEFIAFIHDILKNRGQLRESIDCL